LAENGLVEEGHAVVVGDVLVGVVVDEFLGQVQRVAPEAEGEDGLAVGVEDVEVGKEKARDGW